VTYPKYEDVLDKIAEWRPTKWNSALNALAELHRPDPNKAKWNPNQPGEVGAHCLGCYATLWVNCPVIEIIMKELA